MMFDYRKYADRTALLTPEGERWTYDMLHEHVKTLAAQLQRGCLVFVLCENSPASLVGYLAAYEAKCTVLLLNKDLSSVALQELIDIYHPEFIWNGTGEGHLEKQREVERELPEDLRVLLSTSGSTGTPKLVRLSEKNLFSNAVSIADYLQIGFEARPITSLPMYYSFGLSVVNSHLLCGATLLLTNYSYVQREFWSFAADAQATSFSGVPYTYEILKKLKFWSRELPYLHTLTQAGGKLKDELVEEFTQQAASHGKQFVVMYGQTEATARMSYVPLEYAQKKIGSIGVPIPGGRFEIVDNDETVLSTDQVGELVYYGDNVCWGYAQSREDLYLGDENQGRLLTGDMARRDEDGFYYIVGRKKRFLKIFGNRISLDYTETLLQRAFGTAEFVCVGTDDQLRIYTTNEQIPLAECCRYIAAQNHIHPSVIVAQYIHSIPRSETGKVLYSQL